MVFRRARQRRIAAAATQVMLIMCSNASAGGSYQDAMAACQKAAAAAVDPTDYPCDWKKVVKGAPGASLTGRYAIRERGISGEMTILDSGFGPANVGITTVTKSSNALTCSLAFGAPRNDKDELVGKPDATEACEVRIMSVPGPSIVKVTATKGCSDFCGNGAAFTGTWQLQTK